MAKKKTQPRENGRFAKPVEADDEPEDVGPGAATSPPPPGPPQRRYNREIVAIARETYGMTDDEILAVEPDVLRDRVMQAVARDRTIAQQHQQARNGDRQQATSPPPPPPPALSIDWGEVEEEGGRKRKVTDEDFASSVPGLPKVIRKVLEENEKLRKQLEDDRNERTVETLKERLDNAFAALGRADLYGDGGINDFAPGSAEHARRNAVLAAAGIDFSKQPSQASLVAKLKKAHGTVYPGKAPKGADPEEDAGGYDLNGDAPPAPPPRPGKRKGLLTDDEMEEAGLATPTHRTNAGNQTGDEAARAETRKGLQKLGLPVDGNVRTDDDRIAYEGMPD